MSLLGMALLTKAAINARRVRKQDEAIEAAPWDDGQKRMVRWAIAVMSTGSHKERRKCIIHAAKKWGMNEETTWRVLENILKFMRGLT